jgi:hypothetical protein
VNTVLARGDNILNFVNPYVTCVALFQSTASSESHIVDGKHNRAEQAEIIVVERTINKDVPLEAGWDIPNPRFRHV